MKATAKDRGKPFICDVPAKMLKRSTQLSRAARTLYVTMRALANGTTGELAIRGNPLDWRFISKQAEIGRFTWLKAVKELVAAGYVTVERERLYNYKGGRKRTVLGRAHYFVHRQPRTIKKPLFVLKSDSCTVHQPDPQISSETPNANWTLASCARHERKKLVEGAYKSSSPSPDDDGSHVTSSDLKANLFCSEEDETLIRNIQARLRTQFPQAYDRNKDRIDDPLFIQEAVSMIDERGDSAISVPDAYFASGVAKILDCERDILALSDILARKEQRRKKYMAGFTLTLNATQEQARHQFNRMVERKIR
jgi:hypothetical protein